MASRRNPRSPSSAARPGRIPVLALLALLACASCGGSPAAPVAPVAVTAPLAIAPPPAPPDVSQVADPQHLVVSGRLAKPNASLAVIHGWAQLPLVQADQITELLAGEALGPLVDLDAPIDFALAVQGEGMSLRTLIAVSAGLKDAEAAKAALGEKYTFVPGANGALLIQGLGRTAARSKDDTDDDSGDAGGERTCELAPAFGTPAMRLVCGEDAKALAELGAWLARTATRATTTADLHVEVRMAPLRPSLVGFRRMASMLVGGLLGGGMSSGDHQAVVAAATDLLDFAVDLEGATVEVDLSDPLAIAKTTLHFAGATSTLTRLALAHPDGGSPAPGTFWQLPADADLAFFDRGVDAGDLAKGTRLVAQLLDSAFADAGLKGADRKAVVDALAKLPSPAPFAYGSGLDAEAVDAAVHADKDAPGKDAGKAPRALAQALLGWRLFEVDEPAAHLAGFLKDLAVAWGRPGVAASLAAHAKGVGVPSIRAQPLPKGASLPKGALSYAINVPIARDHDDKPADARRSKGPPLTVHVVVAPDGPRTWMGVGGDAALLASKIAAATAASAAARPDLAPLDHANVGAAGFFDVRSLPEAVVQLTALGGEPVPEALATLQAMGGLPHRGLAPVVFSFTSQPGNTAVATLQAPRAAIEDAVVMVLSHARP